MYFDAHHTRVISNVYKVLKRGVLKNSVVANLATDFQGVVHRREKFSRDFCTLLVSEYLLLFLSLFTSELLVS